MKNKRVELILSSVKSSDSVLDIGCTSRDHAKGSIWIHELLCKKAKRVVGVDRILPDIMRGNEGDNSYNLVVADAESMRLNERFDLIVAGELIEHLSNPGLFLDRVREHLKEEGRLVLTTPNPWEWTRMVRAILRIHSTPVKDHVCWYDKETLTNLLNRYGFTVEQVEFIPRIPYGSKRRIIFNIVERTAYYTCKVLYRLGFYRIASMGLFIKCSLAQNDVKGDV